MNETNGTILYMVVPCYNEEEMLHITSEKLEEKLRTLKNAGRISDDSRVVYVDDGSKDNTWNIIEEMHHNNKVFNGVKLSRNEGHQNALLAGLDYARNHADMIVSMDADLQDDIDAVDAMIDKYHAGAEIVYGVRNDRSTDSAFKRGTAQLFYKMMKIMGAEIVYNHADFRLMSKRAVDELINFKEVNLFLRGIVPLIGFKTDIVEYERHERIAGESKYPLKKMLSFAIDGVTSFSIKPINMIITAGFVCFLISVGMLIYSCIRHFTGDTVSGWTSIMTSIWALGGLQVVSIGVVGKYIGKVYLEVKERPRYIVDKYLDS